MSQTLGDLGGDSYGVLSREGVIAHEVFNIKSVDIFKNHVGCIISEAVCPDDLDDVGMLGKRDQRFVFLAQALIDRDAISEHQFEHAHYFGQGVKNLVGGGKAALTELLLHDKTVPQDILARQIAFILDLCGCGSFSGGL